MERICTDAQFIEAWQRFGSPKAVAEWLGISERRAHAKRVAMAKRGVRLETRTSTGGEWADLGWTFPREKQIAIDTGVVVVSSDHHYWPGQAPVAHAALLAVIRAVKPRLKIVNGDVFDGGSVGRHPPFGWARRPTAADELHAAQERIAEIEQALPNGCERLWNIGNHDIRFERNLAMQVPEYSTIEGFRLADHFHGWEMRWSTLINPDSKAPVMVKHRLAGGVHAAYNNTMKSGLSMVTGHTHLLECKPYGDYTGRRWGVQTGTLADPHAPQFEYTENSPCNSCSGFAVLTFRDGELLPPELCEVINGRAYFRGEVVAQREALAA